MRWNVGILTRFSLRLTVRNTPFSFRSDEVCKNTETIVIVT